MKRNIRKLYHRGGHSTEREAAEAIEPHLTDVQMAVLQFARSIWPAGFTQQEATEALGLPTKSTIRSRVRELHDAHMIENTGKTKTHPPSKRHCIIWRYQPPAGVVAPPPQLQLPLG